MATTRSRNAETLLPGFVAPGLLNFSAGTTDEWELDCYSRPVLGGDRKKLWEVLLTDSEGSFRYVKPLASNAVNSKVLRKILEEVMDISPVKPKSIRFFRKQMFNMISIALTDLDVEAKPSRRTSSLSLWLEQREKHVYPQMSGYDPGLRERPTVIDYEIGQRDPLPDVVKADSYAFVALTAEAFWEKQVNKDNIKKGCLCPISEMPRSGWIHGVCLFSKRADAVAAWMDGMEICGVDVNQQAREVLIQTGINSQSVLASLLEEERVEAKIFEQGKTAATGYHFLSVQSSPDADDVEGFWLLRQFEHSR
jgi:hypothetical protein